MPQVVMNLDEAVKAMMKGNPKVFKDAGFKKEHLKEFEVRFIPRILFEKSQIVIESR